MLASIEDNNDEEAPLVDLTASDVDRLIAEEGDCSPSEDEQLDRHFEHQYGELWRQDPQELEMLDWYPNDP